MSSKSSMSSSSSLLQGYIERITFQNPETGYTVALLKNSDCSDGVTIVGIMPSLQPGETVRCLGEWKRHLVHGRQFEVQEHRVELPSDVLGMTKYLGSGLIKGIGPVYAKRIVDQFGTATLDILDTTPDRLSEVVGIGKVRIGKIKECWQAQRSIRELMFFLQQYGVSTTFAQKVFKTYGPGSIQKIQENPYCLARAVRGIGFKTADNLARKIGISPDEPLRIVAGIEFVLGELADEGHTCYPLEEFIPIAATTLEVASELVQRQLDSLQQNDQVVMAQLTTGTSQESYLWLTPFFRCETGIAREIYRLQHHPSPLRAVDVPKALAWVQQKLQISLADQQLQAISKVLTDKLHIVTGGPGTGKSTIINSILRILEKLTDKILLLAPTGRAAKRMSEITGRKAATIHSQLEWDFRASGFKRGRDNPLDCDLLIVDEASMIDTPLMYSLLKATPDRARLVLVGDINQLPSVGAGNVLKDLILSRRLSMTMLHEIFRQARGSQIILNAHAINDGIIPKLDNDPQGDFFFLEEEEPEQLLKTLVDLVSKRLPAKYRFDAVEQIQVLAPMKRGVIGIENLNHVLQERLNPSDQPLFVYGRRFHLGDKVMQLRNDYKKEVFNGDVGRIQAIDRTEQQMSVLFDGREVLYEFSDLDELVLAYAVSVHKYQGSECPCIVIPLHTSHFKLLHRNLLYTGVTRGKQLVVIVGTRQALSIAVRNDEVKRRYTALRHALTQSIQTAVAHGA